MVTFCPRLGPDRASVVSWRDGRPDRQAHPDRGRRANHTRGAGQLLRARIRPARLRGGDGDQRGRGARRRPAPPARAGPARHRDAGHGRRRGAPRHPRHRPEDPRHHGHRQRELADRRRRHQGRRLLVSAQAREVPVPRPPRRRRAPGLITWGPEMAPKPPDARRAPAKPWRSSTDALAALRSDYMGAPRWPPNPQTFAAPRRSRGASLEWLTSCRASRWPPRPPTLVAPRRSRGAPRPCGFLLEPELQVDGSGGVGGPAIEL